MERSIVERRVVTQEAKTWKSRVSAIIHCVRSPFGSLRGAVPLTWSTDQHADSGVGIWTPKAGLSNGTLPAKTAGGVLIYARHAVS
jgi:hypothetical protein